MTLFILLSGLQIFLNGTSLVNRRMRISLNEDIFIFVITSFIRITCVFYKLTHSLLMLSIRRN